MARQSRKRTLTLLISLSTLFINLTISPAMPLGRLHFNLAQIPAINSENYSAHMITNSDIPNGCPAGYKCIPLKFSQEGSTASNFTQGDCPTFEIQDARKYDCWHFVAPNVSNEIKALNIKFNGATIIAQYAGTAEVGKPNHAWVYTTAGGSLAASWMAITGSADDFVLSHTTKALTSTVKPTATISTRVSEPAIPLGDSVFDNATVTLSEGSSGGSVSFYVCRGTVTYPTSCSTSGTKVGGDIPVNSSGAEIPSDSYTPTETGYYLFYAYYSGHSSALPVGDNGSTSERFRVVKANITTSVSATEIQLGKSVLDNATVTLSDGSSGGSVSFYVCKGTVTYPTSCSTSGTKVGGDIPVNSSGVSIPSEPYTPTETGYYLFYAYYSGHSIAKPIGDNHQTSERFRVTTSPTGPVSASLVTEVSDSEIILGESLTDFATVTLSDGSSGGQVSFYVCRKANNPPTSCSRSGTKIGADIPVTSSGARIESEPFKPIEAGFYLFYAYYSGHPVATAVGHFSDTERFVVKVKDDPSPSPTPTPTPTPGSTPTPTPSPTPSRTASPTPSPTPSENVVTPNGCVPITIKLNIPEGSTISVAKLPSNGTISLANATTILYSPTNCGSISIDFDEFSLRWVDKKGNSGTINKLIVRKVKATGDVPKLIKSGVAGKKAACPSPSVDGKTIGKIIVGDVSVDVKSVTYPKGGTLEPPTPLNAGLSARHSPLSSSVGTSLIAWHVNYNGCQGKLNVINNKAPGYRFSVIDENGKKTTYKITQSFSVKKGDYKPEWFNIDGPRRLLMVTCTGRVVNGSYLRNLVIFAEPIA